MSCPCVPLSSSCVFLYPCARMGALESMAAPGMCALSVNFFSVVSPLREPKILNALMSLRTESLQHSKCSLPLVQVLCYASKSEGMFVAESLIFRSDSNGEDLEGYAGAGLYESITMDTTITKRVDYMDDPIMQVGGCRARVCSKMSVFWQLPLTQVRLSSRQPPQPGMLLWPEQPLSAGCSRWPRARVPAAHAPMLTPASYRLCAAYADYKHEGRQPRLAACRPAPPPRHFQGFLYMCGCICICVVCLVIQQSGGQATTLWPVQACPGVSC